MGSSSDTARAVSLSVIALAALGLALSSVETAAADTVLASGLPQAPRVSADGQTLAWSEYDRSASNWRLTVSSSGITRTLPIAPSPVPFDVDLGDNGHGALVAAYARCSKPSASGRPARCRLYDYDFTTETEHPIAVANAAGASQFLPSMAAGRVAFARVKEGRPEGPGNPQRIYLENLAGGKPKLMPGGSSTNRSPGRPTSIDLSPKSLAFTWAGPDTTNYPDGTSELRLDNLAGGQTLISLAAESEIEATNVLGPTLLGGRVAYAVSSTGDETSAKFGTFVLPDALRATALAPEGVQSTASGSAGTIYSRCLPPTIIPQPGGSSCEVALAGVVPYRDVDPTLATTARPTTISAYRGTWVAFSAYQPAAGNYRLMLRYPNGSIAAAPVPPRRVPFDVQLGPIYGGRERSVRTALTAVYSRCHVEPRLDPIDMLPLPWTGQGCTLYHYYLGSSHEEAIPGTGSRYLPSVWNGQLAFARQVPGRGPQLYVQSLKGSPSPRRLPGGPGGTNAGPRALVLHEGRVAFVWEFRRGRSLYSEMRLDGHGGRGKLLDVTSSTSASNREISPSFTAGGALGWARRERGDHSWMLEYGHSGGGVFSYLIPNPVEAFATTQLSGTQLQVNGTIFFGRAEDNGSMRIARLGATPAVVTRP
ncbi:MAG TPA: hypothetical protein VMI13_08920 [Solirubrobacteraceae bacterium]|nr:hypothetical protein [Solirubrobacteraceae bacterium]